jgi:hypothetical protein
VQRNIIKKCFLDTFSDLVGKFEKRTRKPWITQQMISKMDERKKWNIFDTEEYRKNNRRLRNEFKRDTDNGKYEFREKKYYESMEFQRTWHYDLIYMKTKELGWKETHEIQYIAIEGSERDRIVEQSQVLKIWVNCVYYRNTRPN